MYMHENLLICTVNTYLFRIKDYFGWRQSYFSLLFVTVQKEKVTGAHSFFNQGTGMEHVPRFYKERERERVPFFEERDSHCTYEEKLRTNATLSVSLEVNKPKPQCFVPIKVQPLATH